MRRKRGSYAVLVAAMWAGLLLGFWAAAVLLWAAIPVLAPPARLVAGTHGVSRDDRMFGTIPSHQTWIHE